MGWFGGLPYGVTSVRIRNTEVCQSGRTSLKLFTASLQNCIRIFPMRGFETDSCTDASSIYRNKVQLIHPHATNMKQTLT